MNVRSAVLAATLLVPLGLGSLVPGAESAPKNGNPDIRSFGEDMRYLGETLAIHKLWGITSVDAVEVYFDAPLSWDEIEWQDRAMGEAGALNDLYEMVLEVSPTPEYRESHEHLVEGLRLGSEAGDRIRSGIANDDFGTFESIGALLNDAGDEMGRAAGVKNLGRGHIDESLPDPIQEEEARPASASAPEVAGAAPVARESEGFFSGQGSAITEPYAMEAGRYAVYGTHRGEANFIVHAFVQGGGEEFLFNEIGAYSGTLMLEVDVSGPVVFSVEADGPWSLRIEDPFDS